jgi:hypothetical protein
MSLPGHELKLDRKVHARRREIVTGYVWQTGVMRRDCELYGSTLFVDRLGRPLNMMMLSVFTIKPTNQRLHGVGMQVLMKQER